MNSVDNNKKKNYCSTYTKNASHKDKCNKKGNIFQTEIILFSSTFKNKNKTKNPVPEISEETIKLVLYLPHDDIPCDRIRQSDLAL